jgi:hypothetical protein
VAAASAIEHCVFADECFKSECISARSASSTKAAEAGIGSAKISELSRGSAACSNVGTDAVSSADANINTNGHTDTNAGARRIAVMRR